MNIIFLGAPGTGKGTIAAMLVKESNYNHIAPGNLFRTEIKNKTPLGKKVKALLDTGKLVPDEITNELVKKHIKKNTLFDGYPRTINQAEALETSVKIDRVVLFDMTEAAIVKRVGGRRTCPSCQAIYHIKNIPPKKEGICDNCSTPLIQRKDDNPETVKHRFKEYHKKTAPLIELYKKRNLLKTIDASKNVKELFAQTKEAIE
jgi:adenylate kinase